MRLSLIQKWWIVGGIQLVVCIGLQNIPSRIINAPRWWAPHVTNVRDVSPFLLLATQSAYMWTSYNEAKKKKQKLSSYCSQSLIASFNSLPVTDFDELSWRQIYTAVNVHNAFGTDSSLSLSNTNVFSHLPIRSTIYQKLGE